MRGLPTFSGFHLGKRVGCWGEGVTSLLRLSPLERGWDAGMRGLPILLRLFVTGPFPNTTERVCFIYTVYNVLLMIAQNMFNDQPYCIDQDLVPKPADEVEAEVHERPGGVGPAVLLLPGGPRPSAHGTRGQALVS